MSKKDKLHSLDSLLTQLATNGSYNATWSANVNATIDLKALALEGLKRNKERNQNAINNNKQRNKGEQKDVNKLRSDHCNCCEHSEHFKK